VRGIPSLVILDSEGELITTDGRAAVSKDPEGANFPWRPKTVEQVVAEIPGYVRGTEKLGKDAVAGKTVGYYFSAHWCPPCRGFTPELVKTYNTMKAAGNTDFEVVFVSSDRDQAAFDEYLAEMPWLALPYEHRALKEELSTAFEVEGIPTLVIVGPDGKIINSDGRSALGKDKEGKNFPWVPPPFTELEDSSCINDEPTLIVFADGCDASAVTDAEAAVREVAAAARVTPNQPVQFAIAKPGDDLAGRVRQLAKLGDAGKDPKLVLIDLADEQTFYESASTTVDAAVIRKFVADFQSKSLTKQQLSFSG